MLAVLAPVSRVVRACRAALTRPSPDPLPPPERPMPSRAELDAEMARLQELFAGADPTGYRERWDEL